MAIGLHELCIHCHSGVSFRMMYGLLLTLRYICSLVACLAIDILLILIVDGVSKNILREIRY